MTELAEGFRDHFSNPVDARFALELSLPSDVDAATRAMRATARAVARVRHPDEPDDGIASFISPVFRTEEGAWFWADVPDLEAFPDTASELIEAVIEAADGPTLAGAVLRWTDRGQPRLLARDTALSLPTGFPPLPDGRCHAVLNGTEGGTWFALWTVEGKGDFEPIAPEFLQVLMDAGWTVGEQTVEEVRGLAVAKWKIASGAIEAEVSLGAVIDADQYAPIYEPVGPQAPPEIRDWDAKFARGEAWWLRVAFQSGESDWTPFATDAATGSP